MKNERQLFLDSIGLALVYLYAASPATAGTYLDELVDREFMTPEEGLVLMDTLKARGPARQHEQEEA